MKNVDFIENVTFGDIYSNKIHSTVFTKESDVEGSQFWRIKGRFEEINWIDKLDPEVFNIDRAYEELNIGSDFINFHEAVSGSEKDLWQAAEK